MDVVVEGSPEQAAIVVADMVEGVLSAQTTPILGLATGSSPLLTYQELIRRHQSERLSFQHAIVFLLDEYVGLPASCPESYLAFIRREFTGQVDLASGAVHGPPTDEETLRSCCASYDRQIAEAGGIDLQILGIGSDGHIGFNEPGSSLASRTRLKTLTDATRSDNARFFGGDAEAVPRHVVTQGIGTILEARHLVLIATGSGKEAAVASAVEGPVTAMVPASALQLHPRATVVVDREAASQLSLIDYYLQVQRHRPPWQRP